jgi:hypothetical protein
MHILILKEKNGHIISGVSHVVPCCVLRFMAEYFLEHKIEKNRRNNLWSMIED